jgi:hypothetical protein
VLLLNLRNANRKPDPDDIARENAVTRDRKWLLSQWVRDKAQPVV